MNVNCKHDVFQREFIAKTASAARLERPALDIVHQNTFVQKLIVEHRGYNGLSMQEAYVEKPLSSPL